MEGATVDVLEPTGRLLLKTPLVPVVPCDSVVDPLVRDGNSGSLDGNSVAVEAKVVLRTAVGLLVNVTRVRLILTCKKGKGIQEVVNYFYT